MNKQTEKKGRGRPFGSNSFVRVSLHDLNQFFGPKSAIPVSKTWLREIGVDFTDYTPIIAAAPVEEEDEETVGEKIEFSVTSF